MDFMTLRQLGLRSRFMTATRRKSEIADIVSMRWNWGYGWGAPPTSTFFQREAFPLINSIYHAREVPAYQTLSPKTPLWYDKVHFTVNHGMRLGRRKRHLKNRPDRAAVLERCLQYLAWPGQLVRTPTWHYLHTGQGDDDPGLWRICKFLSLVRYEDLLTDIVPPGEPHVQDTEDSVSDHTKNE